MVYIKVALTTLKNNIVEFNVICYIYKIKKGNHIMDENVFDQIVNFMTGSKLDDKILDDKTYQDILERENACENNFRKMLTEIQRKPYEDLSVLREERSARYNLLAYQQGMRDLFQFFMELARK